MEIVRPASFAPITIWFTVYTKQYVKHYFVIAILK